VAPAAVRTAPRPDAPTERGAPRQALLTIVLAPVWLYRRAISPALPRRCKYEPTCSAYAVQAVREFGILRGLVLAAWRLLRCNPLSHGGFDPVHAQRLFRAPGRNARAA
jgi:putative membrane protein insertion efficiency factor